MRLLLIVSILVVNLNNIFLNAKDITVDYDIKGMMCSMNCPDYIKEGAIQVEGVKKCDVNFNKKLATITFDDSKINQSQLASILSKNTDDMYDIQVTKNDSEQSWWDWLFGG